MHFWMFRIGLKAHVRLVFLFIRSLFEMEKGERCGRKYIPDFFFFLAKDANSKLFENYLEYC